MVLNTSVKYFSGALLILSEILHRSHLQQFCKQTYTARYDVFETEIICPPYFFCVISTTITHKIILQPIETSTEGDMRKFMIPSFVTKVHNKLRNFYLRIYESSFRLVIVVRHFMNC